MISTCPGHCTTSAARSWGRLKKPSCWLLAASRQITVLIGGSLKQALHTPVRSTRIGERCPAVLQDEQVPCAAAPTPCPDGKGPHRYRRIPQIFVPRYPVQKA